MSHGVLRDGANDLWGFLMMSVQEKLVKVTMCIVSVYSFMCLLEILFSSRPKTGNFSSL